MLAGKTVVYIYTAMINQVHIPDRLLCNNSAYLTVMVTEDQVIVAMHVLRVVKSCLIVFQTTVQCFAV